jgi:hypothetical protein
MPCHLNLEILQLLSLIGVSTCSLGIHVDSYKMWSHHHNLPSAQHVLSLFLQYIFHRFWINSVATTEYLPFWSKRI